MNAPVNTLPTLTYHAQQFRIRVEVTRAQALKSATPPPELIKRVKAKMESLVQEKKIVQFDLYETKLINVWNGLRSAQNTLDTHSVAFTLGAGAPFLQGLKIDKDTSGRGLITVTTLPGAPVKSWNREWIKATLIRKTKDLGIQESLSMSEVQACITRMLVGDFVSNYAIPKAGTEMPSDATTTAAPYVILAANHRGDIGVVVRQLSAFADPKLIEQLVLQVSKAIEFTKKNYGGMYRFHKQDLVECIVGAFKGPESVGVGMPMTVLAVTGSGQLQKTATKDDAKSPLPQAASNAKQPSQNAEPALPPVDPGIPRWITLKISPDRMKAVISSFSEQIYNDKTYTFDREWFYGQLRLSGVVSGLQDDIWNKILETYQSKQSLDGLVASEGTLPIAGTEPYLHLVYKDAPGQQTDGKVVNLREAQQRTLVTNGQLIAEIRFKTPATTGKTVTGQAVPPPKPDLDIKIGEGINQKEPGKYYATVDGLPHYEEGHIKVTQTYIHNGDVDLKSGNIRFDGPVEIKGSIDTGATVDVKGPLIVHGMIRGATVKSKTTIEVKEGIVTTEQGLVRARGNITADFIENSRIECYGSLTANKAILNSQIFVSHNIVITSNDGIVGGGLISCRDALVSNNVGFPSGARTMLVLGVDVRALQRLNRSMLRVQKVKDAQERYKAELREIGFKRGPQLTQKHKDRKEQLFKLGHKVKDLVSKLEASVYRAQSQLAYNQNALMVCYKKMALGCDIEISGQTVRIMTEMLSVAVTARKRKDSHICTAEEVAQELQNLLDGNKSTSEESSNPEMPKAG
jgi:uncharacterized protein (DUF342 family)